jgi:uncharacterized protein (TIGR00369 family)
VTDDARHFDDLMNDSVQGFTAYCGFTPVRLEPGRFVARIRILPHHLQQDGYVHAGVVSTLADHTAGYAAFSLVPRDRRILTVEYKISLVAPADGEELECRAAVIKPGARILVVESEVLSVRGDSAKLVAKALLTMAAVAAERLRPSAWRRA